MAAYEAFDPLSISLREQENSQACHSHEHQQGLHSETPGATEERDDLRQHANEKEISPSKQDRNRPLQEAWRRINVDLSESIPQIPNRHQRASDEQRAALDIREGQVVARVEHVLTQGVDSSGKNYGKSEDHEFDSPSHGPDCRSKCFLQIADNHHYANKAEDVQGLSRAAEAETPPIVGAGRRQQMKQVLTESKSHADRKQEGRCQDDPPFCQEFPVVAARIGQAEGQPESRQERHRRESKRLPMGDPLGHWRLKTDPCKSTLKGQRGHAGKETPTRERSRLTKKGRHGHGAAEKRRRKSKPGSGGH